MKALPIIAGVAVVFLVLAGFAVFLVTRGDDSRQAETTPSNSMATDQPGDSGPSVSPGPGSPGTETAPQVAESPGQTQEGIIVSPTTNRVGGPTTGEFSPVILQGEGEAPQHPWQEDGLTDLESDVAANLTEINSIAPQAGTALAGVGWLADEMTLDEGVALTYIRDIAARDPDLALTVVNLPWIDDDQLEEEEESVLVQLSEIATVHPKLALSLAGSPLLSGEVTLSEEATISIVQGVAADDLELAQRMAESPELADGIDATELAAFTGSDNYFLDQIKLLSPALADILEGYAWVTSLTSRNPSQEDDSQRYERYVLGDLYWLARLDPALAERVGGYPWLADGVTDLESRIPSTLEYTARNNLEVARRVAGFPWMVEQPTRDHLVANYQVWRLTKYSPAQADTLMNQGWFQDDIVDSEGALLTVLRVGCNFESYCQQLIEAGQVESKVLSRPTGDVKVFAVSRSPLGEAAEFIFDGTQLTIDGMEELIGPAWPQPRIVVYLEPEFKYISDIGGFNSRGMVMISESPLSGGYIAWGTLFHELAHYYGYHARAK